MVTKSTSKKAAAGPTVADGEDAELLEYYRQLVLLRRFSEIQVEIFQLGEIPGGLHPGIGHEGLCVGLNAAVRPTDYLNGTHRSNNSLLVLRGVPIRRIWAEALGRITGVNRGRRGIDLMGVFEDGVRVWPGVSVLGHNAGFGAGAALAFQLSGRDDVMVSGMGDGASAAGTTWEALFFAGIRKLPVVFWVENNLVSYSTPFEKMSPTPAVSDRAPAFGMPGALVDGNDVIAVRENVKIAVERARSGEGPTLLELRTYRYVGHFIGDPEVYRTRAEVREARTGDPLIRVETELRKRGLIDDDQVGQLRADSDAQIHAALDEARQDPFPDPAQSLRDSYRSGVFEMGYSS